MLSVLQLETPMPYDAFTHWKTTPLTESPYLSVVIPAYNEAERILPTIGAIASHISDLGFPWELIVSDDGSNDDTAQMVRELEFVNLHLLQAPQNGGKGKAVHQGMLAAQGKFVLFADADNSTPIEQTEKLLQYLDGAQYDIAVGSRAMAGAQETHRSLLRQMLSGGLRWLVRHVLHIKVQDTQCGFKLFTHAAAQRLHRAQTIAGFSFDLEILFLAFRLGYDVIEVPVEWIDAPGSTVNPLRDVPRFVRDLIQIKINDLRGRYAEA